MSSIPDPKRLCGYDLAQVSDVIDIHGIVACAGHMYIDFARAEYLQSSNVCLLRICLSRIVLLPVPIHHARMYNNIFVLRVVQRI